MKISGIPRVACATLAFGALLGCGGKTESAHSPAPKAVVGLPAPKIEPPVRAPGDRPEIVALGISRDTFGSGDIVRGWAITSTNVASAQARVENYALPLHRERPGRFTLEVRIPKLPSFVKRDYRLVVSAVNAGGESATAALPIHVR